MFFLFFFSVIYLDYFFPILLIKLYSFCRQLKNAFPSFLRNSIENFIWYLYAVFFISFYVSKSALHRRWNIIFHCLSSAMRKASCISRCWSRWAVAFYIFFPPLFFFNAFFSQRHSIFKKTYHFGNFNATMYRFMQYI